MLRSNDEDKDILLGNKQLLGIFFIVSVLLAIAFGGGYMVGRGSTEKSPSTAATASKPPTNSTGGETHSVSPDTTVDQGSANSAESEPAASPSDTNPPLGAPKHAAQTESPASSASSATAFVPEPGQQFLQVVAVGKDEAEAVADVLHNKGFHAHAVPKPGSPKIYRVLVGPIRDAGDLSTMRAALRRTGFSEVIVQRY